MKFTFVIQDMSWLWDYKSQFSLGILYLSTQLKKAGHSVDVYDTNVNPIENIPHADVYGFSVVHNTRFNSAELARKVKQLYPKSQVIIGGVHPTTDPDVDPIYDSVFKGQAELTILEYVKDLENGAVKPIYVSCGVGNLDDYYPDRSILPIDYIRTKSIFSGGKMYDDGGSTSIMFSRGCPYKCAFCSSPVVYQQKLSYRTVDNIIAEVKDIIGTYGIRQFRVQDDTFTASKKFTEELCSKLKPLNIYYRCSTRVNHINDEIMEMLYDSGCREIGIGIEVADNEMLKVLEKKITTDQVETAINIIRKWPVMVRGFFMIGLPFDSYETVQKNMDFIDRNKLDNVVVGKFIPLPGNAMYIDMPKYNIKSVKADTCMSFNQKLVSPNILRTDMSEEEHTKIMQVFCDYLERKKFI